MKLVKNWHFKANTLALSVAAAMLVASGAQAQEKLEEIQVTGTRIRTTDGIMIKMSVSLMANKLIVKDIIFQKVGS